MTSSPSPFKSLLFSFAFSPSLEVNILGANRLAGFLGGKLILLHVGGKTVKRTKIIEGVLDTFEQPDLPLEVRWQSGKPFDVIMEACETFDVDLLILDAGQHGRYLPVLCGVIRFYLWPSWL